MKCIGLDLGTKTLGVSISDSNGIIALPLTTIRYQEKHEELIPELSKIIEENKIEKIILGLPKNMNNTIGERAQITLEFKSMLENKFGLEVIMQDERLSTVSAESFLIKNDISRKKRKQVIDKMASQVILQSFLDIYNSKKERGE
ncbi:MAG: Holliday junction resolvase RuvX [Firmicutes bacterium]|nr:Holliday junction resolvase RuvX [Bacillota bacterium]